MSTKEKSRQPAPATRRRVQWLSDLIRLEIVLWDRIDQRLKEVHSLPLAFYESLYFLARAPEGSLRVGELAQALGLTVGGTSKVVDRIERAGLVIRNPDGEDRRASRVALTPTGRQSLDASTVTYETELNVVLDAALNPPEQQRMHDLVKKLLTSREASRPVK
jgi:DNA-binding MarR family transcriptional regulator